MKYLFTFVLIIFVNILFAQNSKPLSLVFNHKVGTENLELDKTTFTIWNGKKLIIKRAEFYLSSIGVYDQNGDSTFFKDAYLLVNANTPNKIYPVGELVSIKPQRLKMSVGVDTTRNHLDPATYDASHPLAFKDPSMHWGWASGYRFMAIEGLVDNNGDGIPESVFEYHNLGDILYRSTSLSLDNVGDGASLKLTINLDYVKLFDQMTLNGSVIQHGTSTQNKNMINNCVGAGFFSLDKTSNVDELPKENGDYFTLRTQNSSFSISFNSALSGRTSLIVSNLVGQKIATLDNIDTNTTVQLSNINLLPNQLYIFTLINDGKQLQSKKGVIISNQ